MGVNNSGFNVSDSWDLRGSVWRAWVASANNNIVKNFSFIFLGDDL